MNKISFIHNQMDKLNVIRGKYLSISEESNKHLTKIIDTADSFQDRMAPLNREISQSQTLRKTIEFCQKELKEVQAHYKTGNEVEDIIQRGPSRDLETYLSAMERLSLSIRYFMANNPQHLEYNRLRAHYKAGWNSLEREFEFMLKQAFPPINNKSIGRILDTECNLQSDLELSKLDEDNTSMISMGSNGFLEEVPDSSLVKLRRLSSWFSSADKLSNLNITDSSSKMAAVDEPSMNFSLMKYCEYRKENLKKTMSLIRESDCISLKSKSSVATVNRRVNAPKAKRLTKLTPRDNKAGRNSIAVCEAEDVGADIYCLSLEALTKLLKNERLWLERMKMATDMSEFKWALQTISSGCMNDLITECSTLTRNVKIRTEQSDFHSIKPLLNVLKTFGEIGSSLEVELQSMANFSQIMNQILSGMIHQSSQFFDLLLDYISRSQTNVKVPQDGTVHELTANMMTFYETILENEHIIGILLAWNKLDRPPDSEESTTPQALHLLSYFVTNDSEHSMALCQQELGIHLIKMVKSLLENIDSKAESHKDDEILVLFFQMNNIRYILNILEKPALKGPISFARPKFLSDVGNLLDKRIAFYEYRCGQILCYVSELKNIENKSRSEMKELWVNFTNGLTSLIQKHERISIPDPELRKHLRDRIIQSLIPKYSVFLQKSKQNSFTSNPDKYMKYNDQELELKLTQCFTGSTAHIRQEKTSSTLNLNQAHFLLGRK